MKLQFITCTTNQWPAEAFHENVEEATRLVLEQEPSGVAEEIRELIMREWLAFSWPAGSA